MRQEQEFAQRELWAENAAAPDTAALEARRLERQQEEEEEAEQLRRVIEESEAMARAEGHAHNRDEDDDEDDDDDDDMDFEPAVPLTARQNDPAVGQTVSNRVYDDDDAELQAALKASLEHVPEGWELPELPHRIPVPPSSLFSTVAPLVGNQNRDRERERDKDDAESVLSDETSTSTTDNTASDIPVETVSVDELRRRRLARFGA
jgi:ataxin-3